MTASPQPPFNLNVNESQIIETPGYPEQYPNYANIAWIFTSSSENGVYLIEFISFALEKGWDFLYIGDGSEPSPVRSRHTLSGSQNTPVVIASSDMWLLFQSDFTVTRVGFRLEVSLIGKDV